MPTFTTACPRNCYSTCAMRVEVRDGRLVGIAAYPGNDATPGGPCLKGLSYIERVYSPDRLLHPLRRRAGGGFERIAWDDALDLVAGKLAALRADPGPRSVLYYSGSGTKGLMNAVAPAFWRLYGGCTTTFGDLCWPAGLEATRLTLGDNRHSAPPDIADARLIVLWGKNPAETNIHQMAFIEQALDRGARLIVVDPRRTESAESAELLVQITPGSDGALALGIAHVLVARGLVDEPFVTAHVHGYGPFREMLAEYPPARVAAITGVAEAVIERLAEAIGTVKPATICAGFGMQRYTNSGQAMRAIIGLLALTGNIGRPGAGWVYANLQSHVFSAPRDPLAFFPPVRDEGPIRVSVSTARLGADVLAQRDPPIRLAWIERGNPVTQQPQTGDVLRALRSLDFRVVVDQFLTDTAREADVVLPAKTMFEQSDVITAYWHHYLQLKQKVIAPPGEVRPESEVYWALAERLGLPRDEMERVLVPPGDDAVEAYLARRLAPFPGVTLERLREGPLPAPGRRGRGVRRSRVPDTVGADRAVVPRGGPAVGGRRAAPLAAAGGVAIAALPAAPAHAQHQGPHPLAVRRPAVDPRAGAGAGAPPRPRGGPRPRPRRWRPRSRLQRARQHRAGGEDRPRRAGGVRRRPQRVVDAGRGRRQPALLRARDRHGARRRVPRQRRRGGARMTSQACFTLDLNRCTGCSACRIACEIANPVSAGLHWRSVTTFNEPRWSGATVLHWSLSCNHCLSPSCLAGCPAAAYTKDAATGAVVIDRDRCIGCRYCAWVCPYAAPQLDTTTGTMEKCTFCLDRQRRGDAPACASACPTGALGFAHDLAPAAPGAPWPPGLPDTGTRPALRVAGRRRGAVSPEMTAAAAEAPALSKERPGLRHGLAAEWPLLVFSLTATALVAWFSAGVLGATPPPPAAFLALAGAAMAVGAAHLGRPLRAWRALAGLHSSWVSREIAALSGFVALGAAALIAGATRALPGWIAAVIGVAALVAMDMVYRVRGQTVAAVPHSAMATLTWALVVAALGGAAGLATLLAIVKVVLYQRRKMRGLGVRSWLVSAVRLVVGLLAPLALWPPGGAPLPLPLLALPARRRGRRPCGVLRRARVRHAAPPGRS